MTCIVSPRLIDTAIAPALAAVEAARLGEKSVDLGVGQDQPLPSTSRVTSSTSSDWLEPALSGSITFHGIL